MVVLIKKGENVNHVGFDDAKIIYLMMVVIIKKGENVNHAGSDDAKRIYLMKAHIVSSQQTRSRKSQIRT